MTHAHDAGVAAVRPYVRCQTTTVPFGLGNQASDGRPICTEAPRQLPNPPPTTAISIPGPPAPRSAGPTLIRYQPRHVANLPVHDPTAPAIYSTQRQRGDSTLAFFCLASPSPLLIFSSLAFPSPSSSSPTPTGRRPRRPVLLGPETRGSAPFRRHTATASHHTPPAPTVRPPSLDRAPRIAGTSARGSDLIFLHRLASAAAACSRPAFERVSALSLSPRRSAQGWLLPCLLLDSTTVKCCGLATAVWSHPCSSCGGFSLIQALVHVTWEGLRWGGGGEVGFMFLSGAFDLLLERSAAAACSLSRLPFWGQFVRDLRLPVLDAVEFFPLLEFL
jgi:hypothetical protein